MTVLWLSILLPGYPPPGILVMPVLWLPVFSSWLSSARISCHACPQRLPVFSSWLSSTRISCHDCPLAACLLFLAILRQDFLS